MEYGATITTMKCFERWALENPFFQHFEKINEEYEIINIIWAEAKVITDYTQFGDIVIFDTTSGANKEKLVFGVFVRFNHFREVMIFDATLMFNQTIESFEWVFTNFLEAHQGKKLITLFMDQDSAIGGCFRECNVGNKIWIMCMTYKSKLCKIFDVL
jgi:zinc finger SWIM domain-containing protein 3